MFCMAADSFACEPTAPGTQVSVRAQKRIREGPSGTTLSWQCSRSTTNAISELLLFCVCVCVCDEIYIYICPLLPRRARGVCALGI
jgi:hypothetical protein